MRSANEPLISDDNFQALFDRYLNHPKVIYNSLKNDKRSVTMIMITHKQLNHNIHRISFINQY